MHCYSMMIQLLYSIDKFDLSCVTILDGNGIIFPMIVQSIFVRVVY